MKCRYTSALLRARPSEPKAQEALDPAAPEPCSPVRPAPAFTYSGSLGRSANGVLFPSLPLRYSELFLAFVIPYYIILPGRLCQYFCWVLKRAVL